MTQVLTSLSDALAETVATGGSSVVRVEARDRVPASGIVWPEGVIVTAHHVVERDLPALTRAFSQTSCTTTREV